MAWVRLDDQFPDHPKIEAAGYAAGWLYVCGLGYCNRQLTDGFIPEATMARLSTVPNPRKQAAALVAVGLWDVVEGGWQVHDYLDFQPSRAKVLAEREKANERQRRAREKAASRRDFGRTSGAVTVPPTQPNPIPLTSDLSLTTSTGPKRDRSVDNPADMRRAAQALRAVRETHATGADAVASVAVAQTEGGAA